MRLITFACFWMLERQILIVIEVLLASLTVDALCIVQTSAHSTYIVSICVRKYCTVIKQVDFKSESVPDHLDRRLPRIIFGQTYSYTRDRCTRTARTHSLRRIRPASMADCCT